uniref:Uncharacterized protein n=1 Tax=Romanomermis culicivorax TaxID=13658 RepID=A0A915K697_ROMCU
MNFTDPGSTVYYIRIRNLGLRLLSPLCGDLRGTDESSDILVNADSFRTDTTDDRRRLKYERAKVHFVDIKVYFQQCKAYVENCKLEKKRDDLRGFFDAVTKVADAVDDERSRIWVGGRSGVPMVLLLVGVVVDDEPVVAAAATLLLSPSVFSVAFLPQRFMFDVLLVSAGIFCLDFDAGRFLKIRVEVKY